MSWQKCPICDGEGTRVGPLRQICPTCKGQRIIDTVTGSPPAVKVDFTDRNADTHNPPLDSFRADYIRGPGNAPLRAVPCPNCKCVGPHFCTGKKARL